MIYLIKRARKRSFKNYVLSLVNAKIFLYELSSAGLKHNKIIICTSDDKDELIDLLEYFTEDYILPYDDEEFGKSYIINGKVKKQERLRNHGASIPALRKFKQKIAKTFPDGDVQLELCTQSFVITLDTDDICVKLIYDYNLILLKQFILKTDVSAEKSNAAIRKINNIFRKQRYYYKKKGVADESL